jgi:Uma2 family endonuclease
MIFGNWETDYARKLEEYALLGIPDYWIVDYRGLGGISFIGNQGLEGHSSNYFVKGLNSSTKGRHCHSIQANMA